MKNLMMVIATTLLLTACGSTSHYQQATNDQTVGYREQALSADQWLVNYRSRGTDKTESYQYALRRAAELTLREGYDWFEVVSQTNEVDKRQPAAAASTRVNRAYNTETRCGLLGCTRRTTPTTSYEVGVSSDTGRSATESQLEIRMGKGVRPNVKRIYSADEILAASF